MGTNNDFMRGDSHELLTLQRHECDNIQLIAVFHLTSPCFPRIRLKK